MDEIEVTRTVIFVGDYFTLMTTIILDESLRNDGENDYDFAVRLASVLFVELYNFDVEAVSNEIGVTDEQGEEIEDDN
jgi:hypothetical protein